MNTKLLKQKILDLAIRGKLTQQLKSDGTALDLLKQISEQKRESSSTLSSPRRRGSPSAQSEKTIIPLDKNEAPFEIPANWEWVRLGDVAKKITDGTHHSPVNLETGDFMYVTAKNIKDDGIHLENITYVSSDTHKEIFARCNPEKGDVLLIKDGATTGVVTVNNLEEPFSLLSSVALLKLGSSIESWYLAFVIRSTLFNQMIRSQMKGVGITRVTLKQIESFAFPLPPLAEQQRIVAKIEEAFAEIDAIEKNKELLKTHIKQTRQKILDLAIHGKLVPQNKSDEPASVLLERITRDNPHYEKMGLDERRETKDERDSNYKRHSREGGNLPPMLSKDEVPFEVPENWCWCRLGDICNKLIDGDHNPPKGLDYVTKYMMLSSRNINDNDIVDLENVRYLSKEMFEEENQRTKLEEGDILFTSVGSLGRSCIFSGDGKYCFQRSVSLIHTNIYNEYLKYFFDSNYYQKYIVENATGTAQMGFYLEQMRKSFIAIPPLNEQSRIAAKIKELFYTLDQMERNLV